VGGVRGVDAVRAGGALAQRSDQLAARAAAGQPADALRAHHMGCDAPEELREPASQALEGYVSGLVGAHDPAHVSLNRTAVCTSMIHSVERDTTALRPAPQNPEVTLDRT
jgi:hypothetical protein